MKVLLILLTFSFSTYAFSKSIRIGGLIHIPPYFNKTKNTGIELELLSAAFKQAGYDNTLTIFSSSKRAIQLLNHEEVDAIVSNKRDSFYGEVENIYTSHNILNFIDCAITLKTSPLSSQKVSSLKGKAIWAFPGASTSLGDQFKEVIKGNNQYTEFIDQLNQPKALIKKRIDVAISDRNIFVTQAIKDGYSPSDFLFTNVVGSTTPRSLRFKDKSLRDKFDKALKEIRKNGDYKKVLMKYKELYRPTCN
ncbi:transporter substrate-binding domain-containing protein [Halobacteriovorax sp. JY17]|uniref:substrate-binding periplasmic protein n=1 Tax=Halobacteriovorax sp. JY17 TaxID=2014617 RepID=UPI000C3E6C6E|nr:transporter substrate-binding domain-containing protein [Halobacteriovorax sp. JY17]PIK16035.1 MAG: hypothetical protein CES88_04710 [Halobacteriovorax sp. JY17]